MLKPDYDNSIINLISSVRKALGSNHEIYQPLTILEDMELNNQPLVLLIVDGLGYSFLKQFPDSFLNQHLKSRLTSVFPSTTASAITSFFTGVAPQQHAITGWYTYFRELGAVATVLPFMPRYQGECFSSVGITPDQLIDHDPLADQLDVPCHVVLPNYIIDSDYSRAISGSAFRYGYSSLTEMMGCIDDLTQLQQPGFILSYWADLDSLSHGYGIKSPQVASHFLELDKACKNTFLKLAIRGVKILICSDHGLVNTDKEHTLLLEDHPELASTLTLPLCGEPRCAFCYVRSDKRRAFEKYILKEFSSACELIRSSDLIANGFFGKGQPSPRLEERVGEYSLLMRENFIIKDRLINEKPFRQRGVHGGLSEQELYVPLITLGV
jgi:hypothetical protein